MTIKRMGGEKVYLLGLILLALISLAVVLRFRHFSYSEGKFTWV